MFHTITQTLVAFGPLGLFLLAFLDSVGIPVAGPLDALLIFLSAQTPSRAWWLAGIAVVGSTAGNIILFLTARRGGRRFLEKSASPGRAQRFREWFQRYGLISVFVPALMPIPMPLKLFVISAGALRTSLPGFASVILLARVLRYFGEAWLGIKLGAGSTAFLKAHAWHFILAAVLLFAVLYLLVRLSDKWRRQIYSGTEVR